MKYDPQVESIFKKFINTPVGSTQFDKYQLDLIKRYFQKCWETGYAQGYAEGFYEDQSHENDPDNPDNVSEYYDNGYDTRTGDKWMDNVLDLSNN